MRFYEQFGEVYCDSSPIPLKNPALLISPRESMLIKWGDSEKLTDDLIKMQRVQIKGFLDDLCIIEFNYQTAFTAEEIAYIFDKALNLFEQKNYHLVGLRLQQSSTIHHYHQIPAQH